MGTLYNQCMDVCQRHFLDRVPSTWHKFFTCGPDATQLACQKACHDIDENFYLFTTLHPKIPHTVTNYFLRSIYPLAIEAYFKLKGPTNQPCFKGVPDIIYEPFKVVTEEKAPHQERSIPWEGIGISIGLALLAWVTLKGKGSATTATSVLAIQATNPELGFWDALRKAEMIDAEFEAYQAAENTRFEKIIREE